MDFEDEDFYEKDYEKQAEIDETIQFTNKLYHQYLTITYPTGTQITEFSLSDSSSDTSLDDISRQMLSSIEHYQSVLKQPRTRAQYLTQRIYQAESKFAELMPKLCDTSVELKSRIALLESSVRTRLCYASGLWNLGQAEKVRLQQVYARFLFRMIGSQNLKPHQNNDDDWQPGQSAPNIREKRAYEISKTTPLYFHLLKLRLEWIAYCLNSGKRSEAKFLLFGENSRYQRIIFENMARDPKIALNRIQLQNKMKSGREFSLWLDSRIKTLSNKWIEQKYC